MATDSKNDGDEIDTQHLTAEKLGLTNLQIDTRKLIQTLTKHIDVEDKYYNDKTILYNYRDSSLLDSIKAALLSSYYIQQYKIANELVDIICNEM